MDKLVLNKRFPSPGPKETLQEFMPRLQRWIEMELYSRMAFAINFLLSNTNDGFHEWIKDGNVAGGDGNWRIVIDGDNFIAQRRESSAWVQRGFKYFGT